MLKRGASAGEQVSAAIAAPFTAGKAGATEGETMPAGLPLAIALFAQATAHPIDGPAAAQTPPPANQAKADRDCAEQRRNPSSNEIVVCAVKPDGYRLPPDIVEARRLKRQGLAGRPHNPHETFADHSCATVGPMGCRGTPTVNMLAVTATAAQITERLSKGQEIGSIFQTQKVSTDYQLYLIAKREREAKEAEAAAKAAKAKAGAAAKAAAQSSSSAAAQ
jgi:hypothetical protein